MVMERPNKQKMRQQALLEAIEFCGGVAAFSQRLKINRTRVSNWRNQPEIRIPYEYVVLTEAITQVSVERLSPFTEASNKALRGLLALSSLAPTEVSLNDIIIDHHPYIRYFNPDRSIIIGTDKVLISGIEQLQSLKILKLKKAMVFVLDLKALLLGIRTLKECSFNFLISEQTLVGLRLEQLIANDFNRSKSLPYVCNQRGERYEQEIARMVGFENSMAYSQAKMIYHKGSPTLMQTVDKKQISLLDASKIVCASEKLQC